MNLKDIPTPALVLDLDAFEANIKRMADHAASHGIKLRPHAKTHKCSRIAKAQITAGAVGICTAKLGEAEALAAEGIGDILLTSPIVRDDSIQRAIALAGHIERLAVTVDDAQVAQRIADAAAAAETNLDIMVDLDVGTRRTGIAPGDASTALAQQVHQASHLHFRGFQAYAGHVMHIEDYDDRRTAADKAAVELARAVSCAEAAGMTVTDISGGGTGTYDMDAVQGRFTELQVGSYIFMDREYLDLHGPEGGEMAFPPSLFVYTTVISANQQGFVTTDGGFKSFATDGPKPMIHAGAPEGAKYFFMGDEHGGVAFKDPSQSLARGAVLQVTVPHCDPTVNLYDAYHCVRGDDVVETWPIEARGKSQ